MKNIKKVIVVLLAISITFTIVGCNKNNNMQVQNNNSNDYIENTDYQYFINSTSIMAKTDKGYYYFDDMLLKFFDINSKAQTVVCDQAKCEHNDDSCSGYFGSHFTKTVLCYYNGYLYTDFMENKNNIVSHYVYQLSLDGKSRKKKCFLYKSNGSSSSRFCIHRGNIYLIRELSSDDKNKSIIKIYKTTLDSKNESPKEIFSYDGYDCSLTGLEIYGNDLYFDLSSYSDKKLTKYTCNVYDYNLLKDEYKDLQLKNYEYGFIVNKNKLMYYNTKNNNYSLYDIDKKEIINTVKIDDPGFLSFDGDNYYIDTLQSVNIGKSTKRTIYVVDKECKIIKKIPINNKDDCDFGYKDFLIFDKFNQSNNTKNKYYYDKSTNKDKTINFVDFNN